ncbi:MAG: hypothetical protein QOF48_998 [Verrucomicrobiota bacterium]|jgi:hypothetical protein
MMRRIVEPELLDQLPPDDAGAVASRADLRRINRILGHATVLERAVRDHLKINPASPGRFTLIELGGGDGSLLLQLARRWHQWGWAANVTLIDRQNLVSDETREEFQALGWSIHCMAMDVFMGLDILSLPADVMIANLFLHHFRDDPLRSLLRLAAERTHLFIACEPRRSRRALVGSRFLGVVGCNGITRHDAVVSVRAGFAGRELTALWPSTNLWSVIERPAGLFSHAFIARRNG